MNIQLISDLHLHNDPNFPDEFFVPEAPVLVIAGDLCEAVDVASLHKFLQRVNDTWDLSIFVLGNHEYYTSSVEDVPAMMRSALARYPNIRMLERQSVSFGDVAFVGATLWCNFENQNPMKMILCRNLINDFRYIYTGAGNHELRPEDVLQMFRKDYAYLQEEAYRLEGMPMVIVTHYGPSFKSTGPRYAGQAANACFCSALDDFIIRTRAKAWLHGHTHQAVSYMAGDCQVAVNPMGYRGENFRNPHDYRPQLITIKEN